MKKNRNSLSLINENKKTKKMDNINKLMKKKKLVQMDLYKIFINHFILSFSL